MYATISLLLLFPITAFAEGSFSYDPDAADGPQNWATLDIEGNACGGMSQSGINVPTGPCDELNADYKLEPGTCTVSDLTFTINDHVVQVKFDTTISNCTPPSMVIPTTDTMFDVLQYHIHVGSDHSLDNMYFGADMHIVHKNRNGDDLAVLGMFLEPSNDENTGLFDVLIAGLQDVAESTTEACKGNQTDGVATQGVRSRRARYLQDVYNPYTKLPANATMYYYSGSLTTPPCSEIVSWNVVDTPVSISVSEYKSIIDLILNYVDPEKCLPASVFSPSGYTSRPVQPLNGRTITHLCPTGTESRFETPTSVSNTDKNGTGTTSAAVTPLINVALALTLIAAAIF